MMAGMRSAQRTFARERDRKRRRKERRERTKQQKQFTQAERRKSKLHGMWAEQEVRDIWNAWMSTAVAPDGQPLKLHEFVICWGASRGWMPSRIQAQIDKMAEFVKAFTEADELDKPEVSDLFSPEQRRIAWIMSQTITDTTPEAIRAAVAKAARKQPAKPPPPPAPPPEPDSIWSRPEVTEF